jgi:hypothetical protein
MTERRKKDGGAPKLLSGGNPQIPKGDGDGPVRDYIAAILKGTSLDPVPPKPSNHDEMRYLDIREDDGLDEPQLRSWFEQSAKLPGASL